MSTSQYHLRCRECGKIFGNQPRSLCEDCFSPLEVTYDYDSIRPLVSRELFASRAPNLWRYRELLPLPEGFRSSLPTGYTPLLKAPQLGLKIGSSNLYVKNDAVCSPMRASLVSTRLRALRPVTWPMQSQRRRHAKVSRHGFSSRPTSSRRRFWARRFSARNWCGSTAITIR